MKKKKKPRQRVRIYGFKFPQNLLEYLRNYQTEHNLQIPASAYAALLIMLKQIHREKSSQGKVQELSLPSNARECRLTYSTLHIGFKFLLKHGIIQEEVNIDGKDVYYLPHYEQSCSSEQPEDLNYFLIPHSLFETNILAELVRTSNSKSFELLFSLLTQFRHGVATIDHTNKIDELKQVRNMSTLKQQLGKRSKGVREALEMLEPLFYIEFVGLKYRGTQVWVHQVHFSLKPECVIENSDAFEVYPLVAEFSKETERILTDLNIRYKPRDLFDIMISFKQEVIEVLKYIAKNDGEHANYSARDSWIESYFYRCLGNFENKIRDQYEERPDFTFTKSIGAYFRTVFRNNLKAFVERVIPVEMIRTANMREFVEAGRVPVLHEVLTKY
ncbi:hypothetical protein ACFSCX_23830 [Bacillus salitolerans]|uniref:Uncharacterized protein n=1 Tax=Bacillus salitolerans TaxID=1437434 RepID=A0ABW4LWS6_9BACI